MLPKDQTASSIHRASRHGGSRLKRRRQNRKVSRRTRDEFEAEGGDSKAESHRFDKRPRLGNQTMTNMRSDTNGHATAYSNIDGDAHDTPAFDPLYDGSAIDRTEFLRLALQALRDAGYPQTAQTLVDESGMASESTQIEAFRQAVLSGQWHLVKARLADVDPNFEANQMDYRFMITQQKYLELLESRQTKKALVVLRRELSQFPTKPLHYLSSLMMCADAEELKARAAWDGVGGGTRLKLLQSLQALLPPGIMLEEHRLETLLNQARTYQSNQCTCHATLASPSTFSLLANHTCPPSAFPDIPTHTLTAHSDEVWALAWSHDGRMLATASNDKKICIWDAENEFRLVRVLTGHNSGVTCIAWSPQNQMLLSSADSCIKLWSMESGICLLDLNEHAYTVNALAWMPDARSFVSAGMDAKLYFWDLYGNVKYTWRTGPYRIVDAALSPNGKRLAVVGKAEVPIANDASSAVGSRDRNASAKLLPLTRSERRLIIFDVEARKQLASIAHPRDLTCVTISADSNYALVNRAPDEVRLYNLEDATLSRRYQGHKQGHHVIRNCFGGPMENFIMSGSEDAKIYVWHRETGALIQTLSGHGPGSVNVVAWNPHHPAMFASASDDHTVKIWQSRQAASQSLSNGMSPRSGNGSNGTSL